MSFGLIGAMAALGIAAVGSALGTGVASMGAAGAWKKCYAENKPAPFMLIIFSGMPLSQTLYGFLMMLFINSSTAGDYVQLGAGIFGGLGIAASAMMQGRAGAAAADALVATGKGASNYMLVLGIIETVAIFVLGLSLVVLLG